MTKKKIVIFASGSGTNAENIAKYFSNDERVEIASVFTNNPQAGVIARMETLNIPVVIFNRDEFYKSTTVINNIEMINPDCIILAGFLWLIPSNLVSKFPDKIINIHPALLPKFGGKGMYGMNVHNAVITAGEKESGLTIHIVNEEYDKGRILSQHKTEITSEDNPESLAQKIHILEYENFPKTIEKFLFG